MNANALQPQPAPSSPARDFLHTGMWTLLGLMGTGLVLVPLLQPSIVWTAMFFGWSNVMVAYMAYRMVSELRRKEARVEPEMQAAAPPLVAYTYAPDAQERPRVPVRVQRREPTAPEAAEPALR